MSWFKKISQQQPEALRVLMDKWKAEGVTLFAFEQEHRIILSSLIVPKEKRKQGVGTQVMRELSDYADSVGKRVELTPGIKDPYHGTTSRGRLERFYQRSGFVRNKGRNKDYRTRETMYREPQGKTDELV